MNHVEGLLRECAGKLINGAIEDGEVSTNMLVEAADEIARFQIWVNDLQSELDYLAAWKPMETAPKDRQILVRRHNDVAYEYYVVWWSELDPQYPWRAEYTAYPADRLDGWQDIAS